MERSADWLAQAQADLAAARLMFNNGFHEWACFAAQQAAEKAAKAALQRGGRDTWGHSVATLLLALRDLAVVPDPLVDAALELDKAYIGTRYPDVHPVGAPHALYTRGEAERCLNYAERIVEFCAHLVAALDQG
ncbi:HEPN domain-containing protein [Thermomicrobium sp. CFH 73360]|uniref:HEPN domain-containing protein n=1 Tax=Thermomicrobium sp. CFH 73360 TaxID=2951987 RepID=UPI0020779504|nr:HEPN domain-containing protein [Thermomicrobium sp. CFH 73360]MCM8745835.1 HEPN domain-containing protein [Thermomicrobium sp. CFH 73360]